MTTPLLLINCKTYTDNPSILIQRVAQAVLNVQEELARTQAPPLLIALAVPATEIPLVKGVTLFAQHMDSYAPGAHTGAITAHMLASHKAYGTLINHSEKQVSIEEIERVITRAKEQGLSVVACAQDEHAAANIARLNPSFVAMEPPELIGGELSVSVAKPELITRTVELVQAQGNVPVLVGAGVKNANDVRVALKLGAAGVILASGVVLAQNIEEAIKELASGFS